MQNLENSSKQPRWLQALAVTDTHASWKIVLLLTLIAFAFGIALRMIWVYQFASVAEYHWNGSLMINTNDGYFWAEGARDLLEQPEKHNLASPITRAAPMITAVLARALPFISFETLIFYLPAVLGSLLVVPLILIGQSLKNVYVGFVAALIGVIAWSYYNRTMVGYYDDDMLLIVLPMLALYMVICGVYSRLPRYHLLTAAFAAASIWYYPNSMIILIGVAALLFVYTLVFHRKELYNYHLLTYLLLGILALTIWGRLGGGVLALIATAVLISAVFAAQHRFGRENALATYILLGVIAAASLYFTNILAGIWVQFSGYVLRDATSSVESNITLHFFNVAQTVREAGMIDFATFGNRISGHWLLFFAACAGTAMMMTRHRAMLLALPFVGLGFMAIGIPGLISGGGLRFTIYAVPPLALGLSYLIFWIASRASDQKVRIAIISVLTLIALAPNVWHIKQYTVPTVFYSHEVAALDTLKKLVNPQEDYAISWWDYGYPIRFYTYANTLADGGKHDGGSNFVPSFVLTTPNDLAAARLARIAVEYEAKRDKVWGDVYAGKEDINLSRLAMPLLADIMNDYNQTDPNQFIRSLAAPDFPLPPKTREIYIVLPYRMSDIFGTVQLFSTLDLNSGRRLNAPLFTAVYGYNEETERVTFGNGFVLDKQRNELRSGRDAMPVKYIIPVGYDAAGKLVSNPQRISGVQNGLAIIFFVQYKTAWILDETMLNSPFVQLFALERYNPALFEPVVLGNTLKIYRLVI